MRTGFNGFVFILIEDDTLLFCLLENIYNVSTGTIRRIILPDEYIG